MRSWPGGPRFGVFPHDTDKEFFMDAVMQEQARLRKLSPEKYIKEALDTYNKLSSQEKAWLYDDHNPYFLGKFDVFQLLNHLNELNF